MEMKEFFYNYAMAFHPESEMMQGFIPLVVVTVGYFLPYCIASHRKHNNRGAIGWSNFLFGWTGIGWLFCFIWAMTGNVEKKFKKKFFSWKKTKVEES